MPEREGKANHMKKSNRRGRVSNSVLSHRINALVAGQSVSLPRLGTVKCTKAAHASRDRRRRFSISGSDGYNGRGYTFDEVVKAFGLRRG